MNIYFTDSTSKWSSIPTQWFERVIVFSDVEEVMGWLRLVKIENVTFY